MAEFKRAPATHDDEAEALLGQAQPGYGSSGLERRPTGLSRTASGQAHGHVHDHKHHKHHKLGTFSGVFIPTTLNVLSILMFLRFGFVLGQTGIIAMLGLLVASYLIDLITTLSISAIATNGTVRGGGAYYLISRSLGPEFGGSIGIVFYLGLVLNTSLNAVGLIDCFKQNFGNISGSRAHWMPEGFWPQYLMASAVLLLCAIICLGGSAIFARASNGLLALLLVAILSIPLSAIFKTPFVNPDLHVEFTGVTKKTFMENLWPRFTKGAVGSVFPEKENFQDMFGILFPATSGIFAGANMSGDLKNPSQSIPIGTLNGLAVTFISYALVIISMGASITRDSFYNNLNVIQITNFSATLILLGEFATAFFSVLMGVVASAKLLQALARDNLFPGLSIFGYGTKKSDEPIYAIFLTFILAQLTMLFNLNIIAAFITMTYLMTFFGTNLACFLLKISSAPNFRPSFRFFSWYSAAFGALVSGVTMFFVDGLSASASVATLIILFLLVHYTTPPKPWGDVSQSLIYHQVRKYLLRLKQEHVKFWRPQILLFVNNPRTQWKLVQFCNSLKKGSLYVIGHVVVSDEFGSAVPEARKQQSAWAKFVELSKIKAFVSLTISPGVEWGTRNIVLSSGLGGMRPNIAMIGFYNLDEYRRRNQLLTDLPPNPEADAEDERKFPYPTKSKRAKKIDPGVRVLPTDICRVEPPMSPQSYLTILEDLILNLQVNAAIAKGFDKLELPHGKVEGTKKYIDLWPIQMSAEIETEHSRPNVLTTNFDTYTLILQLGCILETVSTWKKHYTVRVIVFVEYESDVEEETNRVKSLLDNLRIRAEVVVLWLANGNILTYEAIVNGADTERFNNTFDVDKILAHEEWWMDVQKIRNSGKDLSQSQQLAKLAELVSDGSKQGPLDNAKERVLGIKRLLRKPKRRHTMTGLTQLGLNINMRTQRLPSAFVEPDSSSSEDSSSDDETKSVFSTDDERSRPQSPASEGDIPSSSDEEQAVSERFRRKSLGMFPILRRFVSDIPEHSVPGSSSRSVGSGTTLQEQPVPKTSSRNLAPPKAEGELATPSHGSGRPILSRHSSRGRFTSKPVPPTQIASEETSGPSIMFAEDPTRSSKSQKAPIPASGFPVASALSLSFNDLPCRAQHLILNELMRQHTKDTAVIMTTLPAPNMGTHKDEGECIKYLTDIDILCDRLPPVLLVHSNSVTVTTNL